MRIVVDENIPRRSVLALRGMNHHVIDVRGSAQEGLSDDRLWALAQQEQALLISTDKGFVRRGTGAHYGVLVIRLRRPNKVTIHERLMTALSLVAEHEWPGLVVVMRDRAMGVRRRPPEEP